MKLTPHFCNVYVRSNLHSFHAYIPNVSSPQLTARRTESAIVGSLHRTSGRVVTLVVRWEVPIYSYYISCFSHHCFPVIGLVSSPHLSAVGWPREVRTPRPWLLDEWSPVFKRNRRVNFVNGITRPFGMWCESNCTSTTNNSVMNSFYCSRFHKLKNKIEGKQLWSPGSSPFPTIFCTKNPWGSKDDAILFSSLLRS